MSLFARFFRKPQPVPVSPPDALDAPLLSFSEADSFTIRDACEGVQIFGGIGSGKTSGSGAALAMAFLQNGFGGLALTAKPDEAQQWRTYLATAGRESDVMHVRAKGPFRFNFLDYERTRAGDGAGLTDNLDHLFTTMVEMVERGANRGENEAFWRNELKKLIGNVLDLLKLSCASLTMENIYQVIVSAPLSKEELADEDWRANSYCYQRLFIEFERKEKDQLKRDERKDFGMMGDYWTKEFPAMSDRTRSTIMSMFTGMARCFLRSPLRELLSTETTFKPEDSLRGKIILLDLPVKEYNEVGLMAQCVFKYCWQRSIERRHITAQSRPVFLWMDEAQHFVNEHDVTFQTTARSARACTVLLSQNFPNYLYALGSGDKARSLVDSLLGNLTTKIFHNNTCAATNQWAADLFAREWQTQTSQSVSSSNGQINTGTNTSQQLQYSVIPRNFTGLMKGGPKNNFWVEGLVHQGGQTFHGSQTNALRTLFPQFRTA